MLLPLLFLAIQAQASQPTFEQLEGTWKVASAQCSDGSEIDSRLIPTGRDGSTTLKLVKSRFDGLLNMYWSRWDPRHLCETVAYGLHLEGTDDEGAPLSFLVPNYIVSRKGNILPRRGFRLGFGCLKREADLLTGKFNQFLWRPGDSDDQFLWLAFNSPLCDSRWNAVLTLERN